VDWGSPWCPKSVGDNGGVIDFKSDPCRTEFRILLPMSKQPLPPEAMNGDPGANATPTTAAPV